MNETDEKFMRFLNHIRNNDPPEGFILEEFEKLAKKLEMTPEELDDCFNFYFGRAKMN